MIENTTFLLQSDIFWGISSHHQLIWWISLLHCNSEQQNKTWINVTGDSNQPFFGQQIGYPLVMSKWLLKMAIYSGFSHWTWWFSIVMLVYQRVFHRHFLTLSSAQLGAGTSRKWRLSWTSAGSRCGRTGRVWSKSMVQVLVKIRIE